MHFTSVISHQHRQMMGSLGVDSNNKAHFHLTTKLRFLLIGINFFKLQLIDKLSCGRKDYTPPLFLFTKLWNVCKRCCVKKDLPFSMFLVTWTQFQQWHEHGFWPNNCRLTQHLFIRESSPRTWRKWWTAIWSSLSASTYSVSTFIEKVVWLIRIHQNQYNFDFIFSTLALQRVKDYLRKSNSPRKCRDPYLGLLPLWVCSRFQKYVVFVFAH